MTESPSEVHNRLAGPLIRQIVKPTLEAGGSAIDILILLESIAAGVISVTVQPDQDEAVQHAFATSLRRRLASLRVRGNLGEKRN